MFLSKKLLIKRWEPIIEEKFAYKNVQAQSSTRQGTETIFVGDNKIIYGFGDSLGGRYIRSVNINDVTTETNITSGKGIYYAKADSTATSLAYYLCISNQSALIFKRLTIDTVTEQALATEYSKSWSHNTNANIITMFNSDVMWMDALSPVALKYNNNNIVTGSNWYYFVGKDDANSALVHNGSTIYTATSSSFTSLFTIPVTHYTPLEKYNNIYLGRLRLTAGHGIFALDSTGALLWQKEFFLDAAETIRAYSAPLGCIGDKYYTILSPTNTTDPQDAYLVELDLTTGQQLNSYKLPVPTAVTNGLIAQNTAFTRGSSKLMSAKNKQFAFPVLVGYTQNYVCYFDWFIITIP